jgi:plastocyanin
MRMTKLATLLTLSLAALLPLVTLTPLAAADQGATITMSESGFDPPTVTVASGSTVVFKNAGNVAHAATTIGGSPATFNTGGVGSGQSASVTLTVPGPYYYTSATDCLFNASTPGFPCSASFLISVLPPGASAPPAPVPAAVAPTATPIPAPLGGPAGSANVTITDSGISPSSVSIALNGSVMFVNKGSIVHTATSTADSNMQLPSFDTGGITAGQSASLAFITPGTYVYSSETDCLNSNVNPAFNCGYFTVNVSDQPVAQAPQPAGPTPTPVNVGGASASVAINDVTGFSPNMVTIRVGQTVGWLNTGTIVHSVVINQSPQPPGQPVPSWLPYQVPSVGGVFFDSGGIEPRQTYIYTFNTPGTFPYHSSTEPVYQSNNVNCNCTFVTWQFFGTVVVTQ